MLAEDGSGKGAGLVSAIAQRIQSRNVCSTNGHQHNDKAMNGNGKMKNGNLNGHHNSIANGKNSIKNGFSA
jgi:hypothetical protein